MRILLTNDDGWDAEGLAALKDVAAQLGEVAVLAPRDPHSYAGHRVTEDSALHLAETAPGEFSLSGTPADCVRVALTAVFDDIDWVFAGINRGGNLGSDLFTSGTVAAAREAALLGKPAIAISQYVQKGRPPDWNRARELALPVLRQLLARDRSAKEYWNVNLPHIETALGETGGGDISGGETSGREVRPGEARAGGVAAIVFCEPDNQPLDVRFDRDGDHLRFAGSYQGRPRTPGRDIDLCFQGAITVSRLQL